MTLIRSRPENLVDEVGSFGVVVDIGRVIQRYGDCELDVSVGDVLSWYVVEKD